MTDALPWRCIWNVFPPFWSLSRADVEAGPEGVSLFKVYVERPNMHRLHELLGVMAPDRPIEKAVVVGQRGTGKSMDLAWLAHALNKSHLVFWVDAVEEGAEVLQDPLNLFIAMALAVYEGARQSGYAVDRSLLEAFLSTCLDTDTREQVSQEQATLQLDKVLKSLAGAVAQISWPLALATAQPAFMVAGGIASGVQMLLDGLELGVEERDTRKRTRSSLPHVDMAAARLTALVRDVETRCGHPILIVIDGLDRVEVEQVKTLFQRGRDLARPAVRLILTAPLILYATPEFEQLYDFFPHIVSIPNVQPDSPDGSGRQFLRRIVQRRLGICGQTVEQFFEQSALEKLIDMSGGNVRQLLRLVREASRQSEMAGGEQVGKASAQTAIHREQEVLITSLRDDTLKALRDFYLEDTWRVPPAGALGDTLLRRKWILAYADERGRPRYALNPLVAAYLKEVGRL
jgi:hypothetical protein